MELICMVLLAVTLFYAFVKVIEMYAKENKLYKNTF